MKMAMLVDLNNTLLNGDDTTEAVATREGCGSKQSGTARQSLLDFEDCKYIVRSWLPLRLIRWECERTLSVVGEVKRSAVASVGNRKLGVRSLDTSAPQLLVLWVLIGCELGVKVDVLLGTKVHGNGPLA